MWAGFESDRKQHFPLSFQCKCRTVIHRVNQMDEQNVRLCHLPTPTHFDVGWWRWWWWGGVMLESLRSFHSVHPSSRRPGWVNHLEPLVWLVRLMRQLATEFPKSYHSPLLGKVESTAERPHARLSSSPCYPCYNEDNMASKSWTTHNNEMACHSTRLRLANVTCFLAVNDFVAICII